MTVTIRSHKSQNQANLWCFFTVNPYTMEKRRWLVIGLICLTSGVFLTYKYNVSLVLIEGGSTGYCLHSSNHHIICTRLIHLFWGENLTSVLNCFILQYNHCFPGKKSVKLYHTFPRG